MPNRSCHRLLRWLKRAALRSKSKSKQRYKMFLDASPSSSSICVHFTRILTAARYQGESPEQSEKTPKNPNLCFQSYYPAPPTSCPLERPILGAALRGTPSRLLPQFGVGRWRLDITAISMSTV